MLRVKMIDIVEAQSGYNEQTATYAGCTEQKPAVYAVRDWSRKKGSYDTSAHQDAVLETARESIVLLKNEDQRLPLAPEKTHRLLVIGHNAAKLHSNGGGSAEIAALYEINPLLGIKMELGGNCEVTYAEGYYVPDKNRQQVLNWQEVSLDELASEQGAYEGNDPEGRKIQKALREEAVALASEYDDVIFVGGLNHDTDEEGYDRPDLKLPYHQDELITELLKVNPNMVIVMMAGNPVDMSAWIDDAKSIVWMSYAGMEGGRALGEILFGEVNPSGKLVMTMPKSLDQVPAMVFGDFPGRTLTEEEHERMNAKLTETYREGVFVGYRYYDKYQIPVQFPFGHGLSYTTFSYGDMQVKEPDGQTFKVQIPVTNTGKLAGKETVELYVGEAEVSPENPVKELKGFCKLSLAPGETKYAEFELTADAFRHFDEKTDAWKVIAGSYTIYIGSSVSDIRSVTTITIK
jgi:beta-glucosidase